MRRVVGILLILFFWLGPFAVLLPASEESRLPACCRRHGAHHCTMMAPEQAASSSAPAFTAPAHCPWFPGTTVATPVPPPALATAPTRLPVPRAQAFSFASGRAAARLSQLRSRASRGPPASNLV